MKQVLVKRRFEEVLYMASKIRADVYLFLVCIALSMLPIANVYAQALVKKRIYLNNETIYAGNNIQDWLAEHTIGQSKLPLQVLLQFDVLPGAEVKAQMKRAGIALMQYIPDNAYTAVLHEYPKLEMLKAARIGFIKDISDSWKMSAAVKVAMQTSEEEIELSILFIDGTTGEEASALIAQYGAVVINDRLVSMGYAGIRMPKNNVLKLVHSHIISYVSEYREDVPLDVDANEVTRGQVAGAPVNKGGYGLLGNGITIGIGDNVSGIFHVDMMDRIINFNPAGYTNHGVHINGIAGGAGIVDPKGIGMAPAARFTNHFFSDVLDRTPEISDLYNVIATNNSYSAIQGSCENAGIYNILSVGLDKLCNSYSTVLQVFAAANNGLQDCSPYPQGFATVTGGYQPAKNNIVVASTDKLYVNAKNSSRGPVRDGRLKPEISAVGKDVNSTTRRDEYLVASGTSMACPQVAGAAALLAERMKQINGTTKPRADLLKTLLINGATDIGIPGPDFRFGFGFLNVERSLIMLDSNRYITDVVSNGTQNTHTINVPPNTSKLKVLLCWHDVAASPMAAKVLVNDIDIEVTEPGSAVHKPLVLDPAPANINNPAVEKEDRLNNSEQVVIENPFAGNYTITVKGFNVPSGTQQYVVAYDFLPTGIALKFPLEGSQAKSEDSMYVYWDATKGSDAFTLEYSDNDGNTWNLIDNNIPAEQYYYKWQIPANINSGKCRLRLSRNNEQSTSGQFVINKQPDVQLSTVQCPGYIQIEWGAIPNASAYEVLRKVGPIMAVVDTAVNTNYTFSGLSPDTTYYVAVNPIIDGMSGYRNVAVSRRPNDGDCSGSISDGDLMIQEITSPLVGRIATSTELTANTALKVLLRNLDDVACSSYKMSYSINGAVWVSDTLTGLAANVATEVALAGLDLSAPGDYKVLIAVENLALTDPVGSNDTVYHYVSQLTNPAVMLGYADGFETLPVFTSIRDTFGLGDERRWDYQQSTDTGQIRSFALNSVIIKGQRSISLDAYKHCPGNINSFSGTFNLAAYKADKDEVRFEFDYIVHGTPNSVKGNDVLVRGTDSKSFQVAYEYNTNPENIGVVTNSGSISLSDIMIDNGDDFSTSTQVQFEQNDISNIGSRNTGKGVTLDDVRLYTVQNDVQLLEVVTPQQLACGVTGPSPLTVKVRNGVNQQQNNIQLNYRLDSGSTVTETLSSIAGKQTLDFTFGKMLDISKFGSHVLDIWLVATGDTYLKNDSILNYKVRNQPLINSYPYFEDFENGDGDWYTDGSNNSWAYGKPASSNVSTAASGQNAWVTNLTGNYNDMELSYLYSPCFDLTLLDKPIYSSRMVIDIENCGDVFCDAAYMEYTTDGIVWEHLGEYGAGTNWYTDSNYQAWNVEGKTMWIQAELPLPKIAGNVQFRYVLRSDQGTSLDGIGVDDIRIYNEKLYLPDNNIISISPNPTDNGRVNIEWAAHSGTEIKVVMADVMGKEVYKMSSTAEQEGYNKTTLNTPLFSTGMYFMRITIGEKEHKSKIIYKQR